MQMKSWHPKAGAVLLVVVLLVIAQRTGILAQLSEPEQLTRALLELGPWGYLAFLAAWAFIQPFGIPGTVFLLAAALVWPWPIAFCLSMAGGMAASITGFTFARFVGRDFLSKRIPQRFRKYEDALEKRAFLTVFTLRAVFWTAPLLHAFLGVSKVRFRTHLSASFLGYLVPFFLMSFFGQKLIDMVKGAPREAWVAAGIAVVIAAATVFVIRRRRFKLAESSAVAGDRTTVPPASS